MSLAEKQALALRDLAVAVAKAKGVTTSLDRPVQHVRSRAARWRSGAALAAKKFPCPRRFRVEQNNQPRIFQRFKLEDEK
jgi:hypothetical protein